MSWRKISMKFPGTCIVCNKKIEANEIGLWAQGLGVNHEKCDPAVRDGGGFGRPAGFRKTAGKKTKSLRGNRQNIENQQ